MRNRWSRRIGTLVPAWGPRPSRTVVGVCDYCDCRSHPVIAGLAEEHVVLLELVAALGEAADRDDAPAAADVARELHGLLGAHAEFEERGIFAELRAADVDPEYVGRFEHEHQHLHELLDGVGSPGWQAAARDLAALLGGHIGREETDLFPAAHQLLSPAQWETIDGRRLATADRALGSG